jgi:hypothetical protein
MGYTAQTAQKFFAALVAFEARTGAREKGHVKVHGCSWGELNSISDFLQ